MRGAAYRHVPTTIQAQALTLLALPRPSDSTQQGLLLCNKWWCFQHLAGVARVHNSVAARNHAVGWLGCFMVSWARGLVPATVANVPEQKCCIDIALPPYTHALPTGGSSGDVLPGVMEPQPPQPSARHQRTQVWSVICWLQRVALPAVVASERRLRAGERWPVARLSLPWLASDWK